MPKVTDTSGDQRNTILITALYGILVPHAATRMRNSLDTSFTRQLYRVIPCKGKECITCHHRALHTYTDTQPLGCSAAQH